MAGVLTGTERGERQLKGVSCHIFSSDIFSFPVILSAPSPLYNCHVYKLRLLSQKIGKRKDLKGTCMCMTDILLFA